ncbi:MAG TPA: SusD/RagB family nutrient-binding outer membrane lipoprotein, partial [Gemmatimonadaceae bacterium]
MRRSIIYWALPVVAVLAASGCDNGLTGVNDNPNGPTHVDASFLFPNAVTGAVGTVLGFSLDEDLTALWAQQYAENQYNTEDQYDLSDARVSSLWSSFYSGPLEDFHQILEQADSDSQPNIAAPAQIMQSWTFSIATDLWGDIGYTDALHGMDAGGTMTPTYDAQQAVYDSLLADLSAAVARIDANAPTLGAADVIYHGDMTQWAKFANSLRMRLAMRLSNADPAKAQSEFAAAYAAGGFTSNADNAELDYPGDGVWDNPIYDYQKSRADHAISATMVDTLTSMADPRLAIFANPIPVDTDGSDGWTYRGQPNGSNYQTPLDSLSTIGSALTRATSPSVMMSYAEVLFLEAEAAERGWITGVTAAQLYSDAITASMQQYGIDQTAIDAYLAQPSVAYAGGSDGLRQIALQKWIALFGNGPEAYAEWRRTGYPNLTPGPDALNDGLIPVRLPYPSIEQQLNSANLDAAISRQGGASLNDP